MGPMPFAEYQLQNKISPDFILQFDIQFSSKVSTVGFNWVLLG